MNAASFKMRSPETFAMSDHTEIGVNISKLCALV